MILGKRVDTIKRHYLDSEKAFDTKAIMEKMAGILLPTDPKPVAEPLPPDV